MTPFKIKEANFLLGLNNKAGEYYRAGGAAHQKPAAKECLSMLNGFMALFRTASYFMNFPSIVKFYFKLQQFDQPSRFFLGR